MRWISCGKLCSRDSLSLLLPATTISKSNRRDIRLDKSAGSLSLSACNKFATFTQQRSTLSCMGLKAEDRFSRQVRGAHRLTQTSPSSLIEFSTDCRYSGMQALKSSQVLLMTAAVDDWTCFPCFSNKATIVFITSTSRLISSVDICCKEVQFKRKERQVRIAEAAVNDAMPIRLGSTVISLAKRNIAHCSIRSAWHRLPSLG